ncbi:MAG: hypothetical protein KGL19_14465, partial [Bacteroidota bacterium]|nr:hypothetical protein [Bacteroidota bacterium]
MTTTFHIDFKEQEIKLQNDLAFFKEYIEFNLDKLKGREHKLNSLLNEDISETPHFKEILENIYEQDKIRLPAYFYHSTIVSLYSLLEVTLNEICNTIIKKTDFAFSLEQIAYKNIIDKARIFLTKVANLNFENTDTLWLKITTIQKLRNYIVHDNTQIKSKDITTNLIKLLNDFGIIQSEIDKEFFFITNPQLLFDFLNIIKDFFQEIFVQLNKMKFRKFERPEPIEIYNMVFTDE